ncbi:hypothetical protein ACFFK0_13250 [Paenibacillus chartarius]|uniref:Uncharacterized protein n=1 Tax=Paenibacillus chartarius TaxID=747481 RepID=A0ABV6DL82_9BACL
MQNTGVALVRRVSGGMTPMFIGFMVVGLALAGTLKDISTLLLEPPSAVCCS